MIRVQKIGSLYHVIMDDVVVGSYFTRWAAENAADEALYNELTNDVPLWEASQRRAEQ